MDFSTITYRDTVEPGDRENVRRIIESSGFFFPDEIDVAVELVDERLAKGIRSGYYFLFAEQGQRVLGYSCFGPIACTVASYDIFWIAVHNDFRGLGLGKRLLARSEQMIGSLKGERIYVETSSRQIYEPTRIFYQHCGYQEEAILKDFYASGDDKVIYVKKIQ
ncbi:MAG: GNAT family N-acetyltransferase [bacterium]